MKSRKTRAYVLGTVAALTLTGNLSGAAPAGAAPQRDAAPVVAPRPPRGPAGFVPNHRTKTQAVALTSPQRGDLWVVERDGRGKAVLERHFRGRWSTTRLPIDVDAWRTQISGTASNDVWLTTGGAPWHFDGRRWSKVAMPAGATRAGVVKDLPGPDAYVGVEGRTAATGLYRVRGSKWTSLGRPADEGDAPTWSPAEVSVVDGRLMTIWTKRAHSATMTQHAFSYGRRGWTEQYQSIFYGGGTTARIGAWLTPSANRQYVLGRWNLGSGTRALCTTWTPRTGATDCTSQFATGGAAELADGRIIIGGTDFQTYGKPAVPARFGIRAVNGRERVIPGDPGDATIDMTVEPGTNIAWAITSTSSEGGTTTRLQRYAG